MSRWTRLIEAWRDPKYPVAMRWVALLGAIYLISPVDLVPDVMPIIGWIDDAIVLLGTLQTLFGHAKRFLASRVPVPASTQAINRP